MKKHDITIRYIAEEHPQISSTRTSEEIAESLFYDWWGYRFGEEPKILDITVDGRTFKSAQEARASIPVMVEPYPSSDSKKYRVVHEHMSYGIYDSIGEAERVAIRVAAELKVSYVLQ